MPDYGRAAEEMKELIIQDYLKKHPNLTRHDVVTKTVNGRVICETISTAFNKMAEKNRQKPLSDKEKLLLDKLKEGHDDRYASSLDSIGKSRNYAAWLYKVSFADFDEKAKKETMIFLDKHEEESGRKALELLSVRRKFTNAMGSKIKPSQSLIKTLMMEYAHATMNQFKLQSKVYGKEIDLSEIFAGSVQKFLQAHFDHFKDMDESVLLAIGKACQMLRGADLSRVDVTGNEEAEAVKEALNKFNNRLENLRKEFTMIQKLIAYLEKMLDDMGELDVESLKPKDEKPAPGKRVRMAFTSKKDRR